MLQEIELDLKKITLPEEAKRYVEASDEMIDELFASGESKKLPKYMPGDPELAYAALDLITKNDLPLGRNFCEWGSGFGVVTGLASLLGYEAYGIELEPRLVDKAEALAEKMGGGAKFLCTSYLPEGYDSYTGMGGEYLVVPEEMQNYDSGFVSEAIYEGMDCEVSEVDVFFVYPWPMEQEFVRVLFEALAVEGAILVVYHKKGEIYAYRKMGEEE